MPATIANGLLTPGIIVPTALGIMEQSYLEAGLCALAPVPSGWHGAFGDTVSIRVLGTVQADVTQLRASTNPDGTLQHPKDGNGNVNQGIPVPRNSFTGLVETKIDVSLSTKVKANVELTDERVNLDVVDFAVQVLGPQVRGQAHALNSQVASLLYNSPTAQTIQAGKGATDVQSAISEAAVTLDEYNVSPEGRVLIVGNNWVRRLNAVPNLFKVNESGDAGALLRANILGDLYGFRIVKSNAIGPDAALAMHPTAFVQTYYAPALPPSIAMNPAAGAIIPNAAGIPARWMRWLNGEDGAEKAGLETWWGGTAVQESGKTNTGKTYVNVNRRAVSLTLAGAAFAPNSPELAQGYKNTANAGVTQA